MKKIYLLLTIITLFGFTKCLEAGLEFCAIETYAIYKMMSTQSTTQVTTPSGTGNPNSVAKQGSNLYYTVTGALIKLDWSSYQHTTIRSDLIDVRSMTFVGNDLYLSILASPGVAKFQKIVGSVTAGVQDISTSTNPYQAMCTRPYTNQIFTFQWFTNKLITLNPVNGTDFGSSIQSCTFIDSNRLVLVRLDQGIYPQLRVVDVYTGVLLETLTPASGGYDYRGIEFMGVIPPMATTAAVTSSPVTSSPLTTSPLTTSPLTTSPLTTSPLTTSMTTSPLTTSPITSSDVTTSPITSGGVTSSALTTSQVTSGAFTSGEITTSIPPATTGMEVQSSQKREGAPVALIAGVVSASVLLLIIAAIVIAIFAKKRRNGPNELNLGNSNLEPGMEIPTLRNSSMMKSTGMTKSTSMMKSTTSLMAITGVPELKDIVIKKRLAGGNFGDVFLGEWDGTEVALKKLKNDNYQLLAQVDEFDKELNALINIGNHPHVVQFLGKHYKDADQYLVFEYMSDGSLLSLIKKRSSIPLTELIGMMVDCAKGMVFLQKKGILHRDLAARNLLVTKSGEKYVVKISDFGLSKPDASYQMGDKESVPIAWYAPEVLVSSGQYTSAADVWSFGVVCWEILTQGRAPFNWMSLAEVREKVPLGLRLPKPENCTDELWKIISSCWEKEPSKRPNFQKLLEQLQANLKELEIESNETTIPNRENSNYAAPYHVVARNSAESAYHQTAAFPTEVQAYQ